ncbi:hypothetical protein VT73_10405 [Rathayibacter toxicus]|uniref:ABC-2 type transporter transmembrane domain-containing protein n=1 Tax=Rathayibacter toxicus TaxID=145458 RepID=A0A0U1PQZ9_9MICO|nr:hypothetical protein VT73_10405 [Rathayibacter toxicus]
MGEFREAGSSPHFFASVWALLLLQLSNWRWSWPQMLLTGFLAPVVTSAGLGLYAHSTRIPGASTYVVSGSITLALMFETQGRVASNFAFIKHRGTIEYLSTFPVRQSALIVASVGSFGLLALPAVLVTSLVSASLLGVSLNVSWLLIPLVVVIMLPFVSLGALIGSLSRSLEEASSVSLALTVLMTGVGPVVVHPDLLPKPVLAAGVVNPAVYASDIVRSILFSSPGGFPWQATLILGAAGAIAITVTSRAIKWRR